MAGSKHEADEFVSFLEAIETVKRMLQQRITTRQDLQYTLGKSHQKSANFSNWFCDFQQFKKKKICRDLGFAGVEITTIFLEGRPV